MKNIQKSLLAALIVAGYAVNTQAAVTGQVDVKLNISTGCTVGGSQTGRKYEQVWYFRFW